MELREYLTRLAVAATFVTLSTNLGSSTPRSTSIAPNASGTQLTCPHVPGSPPHAWSATSNTIGASAWDVDPDEAEAKAIANLKQRILALAMVSCAACSTGEGHCRLAMSIDEGAITFVPVTGTGLPNQVSAVWPANTDVYFTCAPTPTCPLP